MYESYWSIMNYIYNIQFNLSLPIDTFVYMIFLGNYWALKRNWLEIFFSGSHHMSDVSYPIKNMYTKIDGPTKCD